MVSSSNSLILSSDLLLDAPLSSQFHLLYFLQYCNFYLVTTVNTIPTTVSVLECFQPKEASGHMWGVFGLPWWLCSKESACQCRKCSFNHWVGKIPWRRKWQPAPVFLPGKSHGQRSLVRYSSWVHKESNMTEHAHTDEVSLAVIDGGGSTMGKEHPRNFTPDLEAGEKPLSAYESPS